MPPTDPLIGIAEELYALAPEEFTSTRNEWAKQTKADGDADLAKRVSGLRKPSMSAWVVNMLMRHQGEQMAQVLDLGASLRQAQADLDGAALRDLTRQRRQLTTAVTQQGRQLAHDLGHRLTESVADQLQGTLHAAMVDEGAAAAVRSGLLVSAIESTGVGATDVVETVAIPEAIGLTARPRATPRKAPAVKRTELSVVPEPEETERQKEAARRAEQRRAAEAAVQAATTGADEARRKLRKAQKRVKKVEARTLQAADELEQAKRRVAELEHELETLDGEAVTADERKDTAEERYGQAQEALDEARAALEALR